jgi:predicted RNA methylase
LPGEITEALEHRVILGLTGPLQDRSVLDVGCGDGSLPLVFARNGASRIAGCDPDPGMIARARAAAGTTARTSASPSPGLRRCRFETTASMS